MAHPNPPKVAQAVLSWSLPAAQRRPIVGDLAEEFAGLHKGGRFNAHVWYWHQASRTSLIYLWHQRGDVMAFVFSTLLFLGLCLLAMVMGSTLSTYVNVPSFIIVVPAAVGFGIGATSYNSFKSCLRLATSEPLDVDPRQASSACLLLKVTGNSAVLVGGLMTLIGWVAMGTNMEPEVFSRVIGPAFAVSIMTLVYGLMIKILCYVAEEKIRHRYLSP